MVWWCVMGLVFPADWACGLKGLSVLPVWLHCQCTSVLPCVPCSLITPHRQLPQTISQKNYYLNTASKFWFAGELFLKRCQLQQDNPKPAAPCGTLGASWTLTRIQIKQDSSTVMNGKVQLCEQDLLCSSVRSGINFLEENIFRQWLKIGCCSSCQDTQAHESVCGERARLQQSQLFLQFMLPENFPRPLSISVNGVSQSSIVPVLKHRSHSSAKRE